jgi:hypothetical protein
MDEKPRKSKHSNRGGSGRGNVWKPTPEQREAAKFLYAAGATDSQVAYHLGVARPTVRERLAKEAKFGRELADLGLVGKLYRKAMGSGVESTDGDTACLIFMAKTRLGMWDRPPMFGAPPHPNDNLPTKREELCIRVSYRWTNDPQALPPPSPDRLPPPTVEAEAKVA